jgi:AcrR family transcriptional regulator
MGAAAASTAPGRRARRRPVARGGAGRGGKAAAPAGDPRDTKERLRRTAERLFAERGFRGVSVRAITAAAGANIAGVSYHFGSKEGLLTAIYEHHCRPMAEERRRRLAACAPRPGGPPMLEQIIEAFVAPALATTADAAGGGAAFTRLRAVMAYESSALARRLVARHFDETSLAFVDALSRCLPGLDRAEVFWRFHFLLGALYYTMIAPDRIGHLSDGMCDAADPGASLREMVPFIAAGFRAPSARRRADGPVGR